MLKYEEKLHLDRYYNKMQSAGVLHKVIGLVCGAIGYVVLYYFIKYILITLPDFRPWSNFSPWFFLAECYFQKLIYSILHAGLFLFVMAT